MYQYRKPFLHLRQIHQLRFIARSGKHAPVDTGERRRRRDYVPIRLAWKLPAGDRFSVDQHMPDRNPPGPRRDGCLMRTPSGLSAQWARSVHNWWSCRCGRCAPAERLIRGSLWEG